MVYQSYEIYVILNVPSISTHLALVRAGFASRGLLGHSQAIDDLGTGVSGLDTEEQNCHV